MTCPDCDGKTVEFRGAGLETEFKVCGRWKEPGHLARHEINERIAAVRRNETPTKGRFA